MATPLSPGVLLPRPSSLTRYTPRQRNVQHRCRTPQEILNPPVEISQRAASACQQKDDLSTKQARIRASARKRPNNTGRSLHSGSNLLRFRVSPSHVLYTQATTRASLLTSVEGLERRLDERHPGARAGGGGGQARAQRPPRPRGRNTAEHRFACTRSRTPAFFFRGNNRKQQPTRGTTRADLAGKTRVRAWFGRLDWFANLSFRRTLGDSSHAVDCPGTSFGRSTRM